MRNPPLRDGAERGENETAFESNTERTFHFLMFLILSNLLYASTFAFICIQFFLQYGDDTDLEYRSLI